MCKYYIIFAIDSTGGKIDGTANGEEASSQRLHHQRQDEKCPLKKVERVYALQSMRLYGNTLQKLYKFDHISIHPEYPIRDENHIQNNRDARQYCRWQHYRFHYSNSSKSSSSGILCVANKSTLTANKIYKYYKLNGNACGYWPQTRTVFGFFSISNNKSKSLWIESILNTIIMFTLTVLAPSESRNIKLIVDLRIVLLMGHYLFYQNCYQHHQTHNHSYREYQPPNVEFVHLCHYCYYSSYIPYIRSINLLFFQLSIDYEENQKELINFLREHWQSSKFNNVNILQIEKRISGRDNEKWSLATCTRTQLGNQAATNKIKEIMQFEKNNLSYFKRTLQNDKNLSAIPSSSYLLTELATLAPLSTMPVPSLRSFMADNRSSTTILNNIAIIIAIEFFKRIFIKWKSFCGQKSEKSDEDDQPEAAKTLDLIKLKRMQFFEGKVN